MRVTAFLCLVVLFQLYGLAFDVVAGGGLETGLCDLALQQVCALPARADYLLTALVLMLFAPLACVYLYRWLSNELRFARSTAFLGLLLVTA